MRPRPGLRPAHPASAALAQGQHTNYPVLFPRTHAPLSCSESGGWHGFTTDPSQCLHLLTESWGAGSHRTFWDNCLATSYLTVGLRACFAWAHSRACARAVILRVSPWVLASSSQILSSPMGPMMGSPVLKGISCSVVAQAWDGHHGHI